MLIRSRRGVVLLLCFAAIIAAAPGARAQTGTPVVVLDGKGYGHGVGLAQWGAKYMADAGATHENILGTFYPGTDLSGAAGTVRVAVYTSGDNRTTFSFPYGGEVRSSPDGDQAPGFPVQVGPGGAVLVTYDGSYHATPLVTTQAASQPVIYQPQQACVPFVNCPTTTTTQPGGDGGGGCVVLCNPPTTEPAPPPPSTSPPPTDPAPPPSSDPGNPGGGGGGGSSTATSGGPLWAASNGVTGVNERGRHYRGLLEATAGGGPLRVVNQLDVETYLKGMGEVPSSWPLEAIAAQSVAARTYALRAMSFSGELCDYDLCQVYIGADRETKSQNDAVDATRGQVVTYGGQLATTVYSADAGGITATPFEGFGSDANYPYLQVVRYDTPDPLPWRAEVALSDVASRFGYPGTVTDVKIGQAGPSGRALQMTLDGSAGQQSVDAHTFAAQLSLRSTLFQPTITTDDNVPPPPPIDAAGTQVLPENAAAIAQAALVGDQAAKQAATLAALRDWGSKFTASFDRATHHAHELASNPLAWVAVTLGLGLTFFAFARGDVPSPFAPQFIEGLRFPMPRWPGDGVRITSPLAKPLTRRTRVLRVRRKSAG